MVLKELQRQLEQDQVDGRLLDKLGWTREDIERFVRRWQKMKQDARATGEKGDTARKELSEALGSLGLRRDRLFRSTRDIQDRVDRLRESYRSAPPLEFQEHLRAYSKAIAKSATASEPEEDAGR
jgi:hypothetical protein